MSKFELAKAVGQSNQDYKAINSLDKPGNGWGPDYDQIQDTQYHEHLISKRFGLCKQEGCRCGGR